MNMGVTCMYPADLKEWERGPMLGAPASAVVAKPPKRNPIAGFVAQLFEALVSLGAAAWEIIIGFARQWGWASPVPSLPASAHHPSVPTVVLPAHPFLWMTELRRAMGVASIPSTSPTVAPREAPPTPAGTSRPSSPAVAAMVRGDLDFARQQRGDLGPDGVSSDTAARMMVPVESPPLGLGLSDFDVAIDTEFVLMPGSLGQRDTEFSRLLDRLRAVDMHAAASVDHPGEVYLAAAAEWATLPRSVAPGGGHEVLLDVGVRELCGSLATTNDPRARLFSEVVCSTARWVHRDPADRIEWFARCVAAPIHAAKLDAGPVRDVFTEHMQAWFAEMPAAPISRGVSVILTCWESSIEGCVDRTQFQRCTDQLRHRMTVADPRRRPSLPEISAHQRPQEGSRPARPDTWSGSFLDRVKRVMVEIGRSLRGPEPLGLPAPSRARGPDR